MFNLPRAKLLSTVAVALLTGTSAGSISSAPLAAGLSSSPFPLRISADGRHLLDSHSHPFLYHADTAWFLLLNLDLEEADEYLATRRSQGFNAIQVMLTGTPGMTNRLGARPFLGNHDFDQRNEVYFEHVDRVLKRAEQHGLMLAMAPLWISCCRDGWAGKDDEGQWLPMNVNGPDRCRELGRYLGRRYSQFPNILWILGGDNDPHESRQEIDQLALGLMDTAPDQLRTYHAASSHSSTDAWPDAEWLTVSMVYTYFRGFNKAWTKEMPDVYEVSWREYSRPLAKPFFLGESTYEGEHDAWGSALQARKQAYWVILGGGTGHAYGSPNWRCDRNWREGLQRPGAISLIHWYRLFTSRPWWLLVPDSSQVFLTEGRGEFAANDLATAAIASDGSFAVAYLPSDRTLRLDLNQVNALHCRSWWFDPRNGQAHPAGEWRRKKRDSFPQPLLTPPGEGDWALVVEDAAKDWPTPGTQP